MTRTPLADIEAQLLQHTPERSAAGPIRGVAARTRDVIEVVANIATYYGSTISEENGVSELALRLELGLPRESIALARQLGNALGRGDYLRLLDAGILSWVDVENTEPDQLRGLLGPTKADLVQRTASVQVADT
jgi:hypothetical protein